MSGSVNSAHETQPSTADTTGQKKPRSEERPRSTDIEEFKKQITSSDCLLILLGTRRAGRTTFIYELMDSDIPEVIRSPERENGPDTTEVDFRILEPTSFTKGHRLFMIDTPPLIGERSTTELILELQAWTEVAAKKKVAFVGFIFIQSMMASSFTSLYQIDWGRKVSILEPCFAPLVKKKIPHQLVLAASRWAELVESALKYELADSEWRYRIALKTTKAQIQQHRQDAQEKADKVVETGWNELLTEPTFWKEWIDNGGAKVVKWGGPGTNEKDIVMDIIPVLKQHSGWMSSLMNFPSRISHSSKHSRGKSEFKVSQESIPATLSSRV